MDSSNRDFDHDGAHAPARTRRRALVITGIFVFVMIASLVIFMRVEGGGRTLVAPNGVTLKFAGVGRGSPVPKASHRGSLAVDMDGEAWRHDYAPPLTWRNHAHRLAPPFVQKYLPANWRARPSSSHTGPYAEVMLWEWEGPRGQDLWRYTWVDQNGHESEGTARSVIERSTAGQVATGTLPPSRSPKVILRVREYQEKRPVSEWPLIAELPMNNPCLLRTPMPVVDKLPVTRTAHGVSLTLERITVNPMAPDHECSTLNLSMPHGKVHDWSVGFQFFDERRTEVMFSNTGMGTRAGGFQLSTSSSLWSDAPWHVRMTLTPGAGLPPVLGAQFQFLRMPLPGKDRPAGTLPQTETAGGHTVTLSDITADPAKGGNVLVTIVRPDLPETRRNRILSATDNLGRAYRWNGGQRSTYGSTGEVTSQFSLAVPDGPSAETLDVIYAIDEPIVFDFCVMPEFKGLNKEGARP